MEQSTSATVRSFSPSVEQRDSRQARGPNSAATSARPVASVTIKSASRNLLERAVVPDLQDFAKPRAIQLSRQSRRTGMSRRRKIRRPIRRVQSRVIQHDDSARAQAARAYAPILAHDLVIVIAIDVDQVPFPRLDQRHSL